MSKSASALGDKAIIGRIFQALEETEVPSWVTSIGMLVESDVEQEVYRFANMVPGLREWVGGRHADRLSIEEIIIRNKKYEATLECTREELRRDKSGNQLQRRIDEMAIRAQQHWAQILTDLIVAGTSTTGYDGANFFSASHSEGDSGTQSNLLTYDRATANKNTAADMEAAIFTALETILGYKDNQGEPINQGLSQLTVMTPVQLFGAANRALNDGVITDGAGTRTNSLINLGGFDFELVVNPRLAGSDDFYIMRSDAAMKPFVLQQETGVEISVQGEGSSEAFHHDRHLYGLQVSRNCGPALWSMAAKMSLTNP